MGGSCGPTWATGPQVDRLPLGPILEAPGVVSGLDDLAVVRQTIEERGGHLGVAEDGRPFAEGQVGGDDDRGALVEPADEVEQQLASGLGEGQVAELVEDDEVAPGQLIGEPALAAGAGFGPDDDLAMLCREVKDKFAGIEPDALRPSGRFDPNLRRQVKRDADALTAQFAGYFAPAAENREAA